MCKQLYGCIFQCKTFLSIWLWARTQCTQCKKGYCYYLLTTHTVNLPFFSSKFKSPRQLRPVSLVKDKRDLFKQKRNWIIFCTSFFSPSEKFGMALSPVCFALVKRVQGAPVLSPQRRLFNARGNGDDHRLRLLSPPAARPPAVVVPLSPQVQLLFRRGEAAQHRHIALVLIRRLLERKENHLKVVKETDLEVIKGIASRDE